MIVTKQMDKVDLFLKELAATGILKCEEDSNE